MDTPLIAGTVATVAFAVSNLPMLTKALRTRDVSSYSLPSLVIVNAANLLYSLYVFTLPFGPIWALHTFYVVSCAIMLTLCARARCARGHSMRGNARLTDGGDGASDPPSDTWGRVVSRGVTR